MKRKPIVGETLYDLNVGDSARNRPQELIPVIVRKVGNKYFSCSSKEWPEQLTQYELGTWRENTRFSRNHQLYIDKQDWLDKKEANEIYERLQNIFTNYVNPNIPLEKLREVEKLIAS